MSTTLTAKSESPVLDPVTHDNSLQYRALYSGALVGALLGALSVMLLFATDHLSSCIALTPIPILGVLLSLRAWLKIRRESDLYTGGPLALVGLVLSLVFLVSGVSRAAYIYATEVPDGYERITFLDLKPNQTEERAGKPIPDHIAELVGERVFIKGYIRPVELTSRHNIETFLLVRDNNQCCFGDMQSVKYFDQMGVKLFEGLKIDYDDRLFRVAGRLIVEPQNLAAGGTQPIYFLEADYIE